MTRDGAAGHHGRVRPGPAGAGEVIVRDRALVVLPHVAAPVDLVRERRHSRGSVRP